MFVINIIIVLFKHLVISSLYQFIYLQYIRTDSVILMNTNLSKQNNT